MTEPRNLEVLIANSREESEEIFRFRYRLLAERSERTYPNADHDLKTLSDVADRAAMHVYVKVSGKIAACLRIIIAPLAKLPVYMSERYALGPFQSLPELVVSFTDYLVVDTSVLDARGANLLMTAAYKIACARHSSFDFTNASPGEVAVFERLGYRRYAENYQDPDFGFRVPMVLPTGDTDHLARVGSPFGRISRRVDHDIELVSWFRRTYAEVCDAVQPAAMDDDELWAFLTRRLEQTPHHGIPLLMALDHKDAMRFLRLATIIKCGKGENIVASGEVGNEMFVVLQGSVDVRGNGHRLSTFGRGGIFGEMAYLNAQPRSADVVAREPSEILVITQDTMKASMEKMPDVAARILFNLSLILIERLKDTTTKFVEAKSTAA
ncbi:Crp/Fnr family transcriptional regulator [Minwuia sp.]|uniref:Crp/Fnr family transcriptional regulator n=1 Tax=Minwuia sp. TaxID=2493630 RepID=UPI003A8F01FF